MNCWQESHIWKKLHCFSFYFPCQLAAVSSEIQLSVSMSEQELSAQPSACPVLSRAQHRDFSESTSWSLAAEAFFLPSMSTFFNKAIFQATNIMPPLFCSSLLCLTYSSITKQKTKQTRQACGAPAGTHTKTECPTILLCLPGLPCFQC